MSATEAVASPRGFTRAGSFARVALAYAVALAAATPIAASLRETLPPYPSLAIADVAATLVVFGFSFAWRNTSVYDAYWMAAPPLFCAGLWALAVAPEGPGARATLVAALVLAWAVRLTWNWIRGWQGLDHEDFRYRDMQRTTGRLYWLVSLTGLHLFPTALVLLAMLPLIAIFSRDAAPLGALDALALAVTLGGIVVQKIADDQLRAFVRQRAAGAADASRGAVCDVGLWSWSRHPNYFGELSFWCGLYVFALASGRAEWWSAIGPLAIAGLFLFASIPMMERRQRARKPAYAEYARRTSMLVPLPPRRR